ncbi:MAG: hypothetical protein ACOC84_07855 [Actinomycetota bacterium]
MPRTASDPADLGELLHVVFRRLRRRWALQLAPFGLTPHQFRALNAVAGPGGGPEHRQEGGGRRGWWTGGRTPRTGAPRWCR